MMTKKEIRKSIYFDFFIGIIIGTAIGEIISFIILPYIMPPNYVWLGFLGSIILGAMIIGISYNMIMVEENHTKGNKK